MHKTLCWFLAVSSFLGAVFFGYRVMWPGASEMLASLPPMGPPFDIDLTAEAGITVGIAVIAVLLPILTGLSLANFFLWLGMTPEERRHERKEMREVRRRRRERDMQDMMHIDRLRREEFRENVRRDNERRARERIRGENH